MICTDNKRICQTLAAIALMALAACDEAEPVAPSVFEATGELIALSGGDAGAVGACVTCHGLQGQGDGNLSPRLAGLDAGYIARQLEYFSAGQRRHPQMSWIAARLDWRARVKVANHYAALPVPEEEEGEFLSVAACSPAIARLYQQGDAVREIEACAVCHGANARGVGAGNPPLAGQPAPYLVRQLENWRSGERYGDPLDAMTHVSRLLSAAELVPLAEYSAHLTDANGRREPRAICPLTRRRDPRSGA